MDTPIQINLSDNSGSTDLVAEMMQTGRSGSADVVEDELAFRVRAFDPRRGTRDGDGIRNVDMIILDSDGREVYRKRENNAGYCAFGGGEPECSVYDFAANDYTWPNGEEIRRGEEYTLRAGQCQRRPQHDERAPWKSVDSGNASPPTLPAWFAGCRSPQSASATLRAAWPS